MAVALMQYRADSSRSPDFRSSGYGSDAGSDEDGRLPPPFFELASAAGGWQPAAFGGDTDECDRSATEQDRGDSPQDACGARGSNRLEEELEAALGQIEQENVSGVLRKLDSIRQLAGDAQVLRRKENKEHNTRRLHIAQMYSLLLEEAEFSPQNVQQRNVLGMLEGIMLQNAEIFFFSVDEVRKNLVTGPSVKLKDAISRPYRYADRLTVDSDVLSRMLNELQTDQILDIVNKSNEFLTFKQTTYQVKTVEERDSSVVKNASALAIYKHWVFVADATQHCIWRQAATRFSTSGQTLSDKLELFAGSRKENGFMDGGLLDARFNSPMSLAIAEMANLMFVADSDNNAVRQINLKSNTVSTIDIRLDPLVMDYLNAPFLQPKGICIIYGERCMLEEMERCQLAQCMEFKLQSEAIRDMVEDRIGGNSSSSSSSTSSSSNSSSDLSGVSGSSNTSSASSSTALSDVTPADEEGDNGKTSNSAAGNAAPARNSTRNGQPPGLASKANLQYSALGNKPVGDVAMLSLEQSLAFDRMSRYSVLHEAPRNLGLHAENKFVEAPVGHVHCHRDFDTISVCSNVIGQSRRQSVASNVRDDTIDPLHQIRLAITTDHCVWFIDPNSRRTHILAGHPKQYGYNDSELGLFSRFSSPKGVISIRSVLFIADYWNNVVRCVNLYTTRVDTVVDFCPQGPVAMCMSNSGVLYTLDSDNVHYTNILRIMSTQRNGDRRNTTNTGDDQLSYQSLFSQPRTRTSSIVSSSTFPGEVWDANGAHSKRIRTDVHMNFGQTATSPGENFRSRLQAHLAEAAEEQERLQERRAKKNRKRERKKEKREKKAKRERNSPEVVPTYIDPRLRSGSTAAVSHSIVTAADAEEDPDGLLGDDVQRANSPDENKIDITVSTPSTGDVDIPNRLQIPRSRLPIPKMAAPQVDYVEQTRKLLTTMGNFDQSRRPSMQGDPNEAPMTLSDLGIGSRRGSAIVLDGSRRGSLMDQSVPEQSRSTAGLGLVSMAYSQEHATVLLSDTSGEASSDVGTVLVSGGKAFYRSAKNAWMERGDMSREVSRRASMVVEDASSSSKSRRDSHAQQDFIQGEDEDGFVVNFVDMTKLNTDGIENRRSSTMTDADSLAFNRAVSCLTRRDSQQTGQGNRKISFSMKASPEDQEQRRASIATGPTSSAAPANESESRRGSVTTDYIRRLSGVEIRRLSGIDIGDPVGGRKLSAVETRRLSGQTNIMPTGRLSIHQRRGSLALNIMPTVLDRDEREDEGDNSSTSESEVSGGKASLGKARVDAKSRCSSKSVSEAIPEEDASEKAKSDDSVVSDRSKALDVRSREACSDARSAPSNTSLPDANAKEKDHQADSPVVSTKASFFESVESLAKASEENDEEREEQRHERDWISYETAAERSDDVSRRNSKSTTTSGAREDNSLEFFEHPQIKVHSVDDGTSFSPTKSPNTLPSSAMGSSPTAGNSPKPGNSPSYMPLSRVPFTRDLDVEAIPGLSGVDLDSIEHSGYLTLNRASGTALRFEAAEVNVDEQQTLRRSTWVSTVGLGNFKRRAISKTWRVLPVPEPLSFARRGPARKYPNTPLSIGWFEKGVESVLFVGLLSSPTLLKILPPKHHEPDKAGRFNALPIDSRRALLADETCHQIWLLNHQTLMKKHLAGCGKRGYLDGPLEICRMHSPCSMTLDPRSHYIYVADRGNHVIRKIDLLSGLMSTVVGSGFRGNSDGGNPRRQALDSPFEVSFAEPHNLIISCADNSVRSFNLKTGVLETVLVGS